MFPLLGDTVSLPRRGFVLSKEKQFSLLREAVSSPKRDCFLS